MQVDSENVREVRLLVDVEWDSETDIQLTVSVTAFLSLLSKSHWNWSHYKKSLDLITGALHLQYLHTESDHGLSPACLPAGG
jgi:hypothetical protein